MWSPLSLTCTKGLCAGPLGLSRSRQECLLEQAGMFAKAVKTSAIHVKNPQNTKGNRLSFSAQHPLK